MVDTAWAQAALRNFKTSAAAENNIALRHAHIVKFNMHVAVWRIVFAENVHRAYNFDAFGIHWYENLRLTVMLRCIGVSHDHCDHNLAARITRA